MSFIDMYEWIEDRARLFEEKGHPPNVARQKAWDEFHEKLDNFWS